MTNDVAAGRVVKRIAGGISQFRSAVNESFVPLQVSTSHPDRFRAVMHTAVSDRVHVTEIRATDHVVERTPALIARGDDAYFKVNLMLAGKGLLIQDRREATLTAGDLSVYDTSRPYTLVFDEEFRAVVVMFPRDLITLPQHLMGELTATRLSGGLAPVVAPFISQLAANLHQLEGPTGARLVHSAVDLLTTIFTRELGLENGAADPHQATLHRIRAFIEAHLHSHDLTPARIAAAHFISTRHLHGLFQEQGKSVSTWIRERRLERCRRDLTDPLCSAMSVSEISARAGFADAAHFSRAFKAAFGVAPSAYRAAQNVAA